MGGGVPFSLIPVRGESAASAEGKQGDSRAWWAEPDTRLGDPGLESRSSADLLRGLR